MQDTAWDGGRLPGPSVGDVEFCEAYTAITYTYVDRGEDAEPLVRRSLALLEGSGRHVRVAGMQLALARALIRHRDPDPEAAAAALNAALSAAEGNDHGATADRAAGIYRRLTARQQWATLPAIRDLSDRLPDRRALTPGATV